ncbi:hypothetical protein CK203_023765 [Vitis vinifera]|uniref:COX assembly mitochondrial protein 2 homolog n=1 Tax=Vitis vinifera TaxID=29760 RepID=A0A438J9Y2_VITVI|nr:hypothetical protein CK203_023765 [Vitis vinifera]
MTLYINELELTVGNQNPFSVIHPWTGPHQVQTASPAQPRPTQPDSIMILNDSLYRSSILSDSQLPLLSPLPATLRFLSSPLFSSLNLERKLALSDFTGRLLLAEGIVYSHCFPSFISIEIHVHRSLETTLAMCKVEICRTLGKLSVKNVISIMCCSVAPLELFWGKMHPPLTIYKHPMCAEIIEAFQKCHSDHPVGKFFGECTELKIKLDRCFRQEVSSKVVKRKKNLEKSRKLRETLQAYRKETAEGAN